MFELKETEKVEFKRELNESIKKELIAFANTNGGEIYIGIDDDGKVIGLDNAKQDLESVSNSIRDSIKPDLTLITSAKIVEIGITSSPATEEAIRQMIIESDGTVFEKNRCVNQDLTYDYAKKIFAEKQIGFEKHNQRTLGLINEDGYYTNLGLLLSEQCQHSIKCALYDENTKLEFRDRKEFTGSILRQLDEAYEYISLQNKVESNFKGLNRVDREDYPYYAIREALINAVVHRDYSFSGSTLIHIFDDRIEFVSLGGLVAGLTLEDIMLGVSESRNKNFANCFYRLKLIESYGTGIQRIYESYLKYKMEPEFKISENAFVVVLPNVNYKMNLIDNDEKVFKIIKIRGNVSRKDIESELKLSKSTITLILNRLLEEGKIKQEGKARNTTYHIV